MKKAVALIIAISCLICMAGCADYKTAEQSRANFDIIENQLKDIAQKRTLNLEEIPLKPFENQYCKKEMCILVGQGSKINIMLQNSGYNSSKGAESFSLEYYVDSNDEIDIELFCELANALSKKSISVRSCSEFIASSDDKYSAEKYGYKKADNVLVYKYYPLNYFEDWGLFYTEYTQHEKVLSFSGSVKNLT